MKKLPLETRQTLKNETEFHLQKIGELDRSLRKYAKNLDEEQGCVLSAYYLSGFYSCLEDIFEKIARVFENNIENPAAWHSELLLRMRIAIDGIRPAVIDDAVFRFLDELRSFRHVFRQSYVFSLDADRIKLLISKWKKNKGPAISQISSFVRNVTR